MTDRPVEDTNIDPSRGLQIRWALTYHAAYPEITDAHGKPILKAYQRLRLKQKMPSALGAPAGCETDELLSYERILLERLVERLRSGGLFAQARVGRGSLVREHVPADWWTSVRFNVSENTAEANGTVIYDILIFAPPEKGMAASQSEVDAWMQAHATPQSKRDLTIADGMRETGATWRSALDAWNKLPREIRGTRGTKKT